jgi:uncharacterized protein YhbP (UPF0306 family)
VADDGKPTAEEWRAAALELIHSESTLTLATADQDGPWSAPVYYVFLNDRFYFFSSPLSRHIRQVESRGQAAASIFHQADSWQNIRGLQMRGVVERVPSAAVSIKPIAAYLKRFPFTRDFFPNSRSPGLQDFRSRFKARLYHFSPTSVYFSDNRFGFGTRQRIDWH